MVPAIGYAIHERNRSILDDPAVDAAEITFDPSGDVGNAARAVGDADVEFVSVNASTLSAAGSHRADRHYLDDLKALTAENGADAVSDHLALTDDEDRGDDAGRHSPPAGTPSALEATCRQIDFVQNRLGDTRLYVENAARPLRPRNTMTEAEFLAAVLRRTGCGWLLDVTVTYADALNRGYDPYEFIEEVMPAAQRVQMHLAGGYFDYQLEKYIDSPAHPIPRPVLDLYEFALEAGRERVDAVFIERDQNLADEEDLRREVRLVREIAESAAALV